MPDRRDVVVDSTAWISLLEDEPDRGEHVQRLLERAERGEVRILVSTITIAEIVKGPKAADPPLTESQERTFTEYMDNPFITLVSVDPLVASRGRDLRRAIPGLKTADALILASALVTGAEAVYSYDADDMLKLDGHPAVGATRILMPPVEDVQLVLPESQPSDRTAPDTLF